jgi:hypothetical protein
LGDLRYGSGTNTLAALAGNTTTSKLFLTQTGTGTVSAAPAWNALASGDIPANAANTSGTAANLSGTPTLPNGTAATTQAATDTSTKLATDAFVTSVLAAPPAIGGTTPAAGSFTTLASTGNLTLASNGILSAPASANIQLGGANASTPTSQTLSAQGALAGTALNTAGGTLTIQSGAGTGTGTPSTITFQVPASTGSSSTAQQSFFQELNISDTAITFGETTHNPTTTFTGTGTVQVNGLLTAAKGQIAITNGTSVCSGTGLATSGGGTLFFCTNGTSQGSATSGGGMTISGILQLNGHIASTSTNVTSSALSGCGTTPAINATATDSKGTITEGTTATGCTLTFLQAYATAPDCVISSPTGNTPTSYTTSTTALTIVNASATGDKFTYQCIQ